MGTVNNHNNDAATAAAAATIVAATLSPSINNNHKKSPPKPSIKPAEPPTPTSTATPSHQPLRSDSDFISIPSYSRWFSWDNIHPCELRFLPEFFDGRSASKNPKTYKYYRNAIIQRFRDNASSSTTTKKITFTEVRKTIVGDVGSIRRVFDFLEAWGLINYSPSVSSTKAAAAPQPQVKWDDNKDSSSPATKSASAAPPPDAPPPASADSSTTAAAGGPKKRFCSACKSPCSISCFTSDKVPFCCNWD